MKPIRWFVCTAIAGTIHTRYTDSKHQDNATFSLLFVLPNSIWRQVNWCFELVKYCSDLLHVLQLCSHTYISCDHPPMFADQWHAGIVEHYIWETCLIEMTIYHSDKIYKKAYNIKHIATNSFTSITFF